MLTGNELVILIREHIHETVADFWTPANILIAANMAQKRYAIKMQRAAERVFYGSCVVPTVIGTGAYKLPDGTLYSAAKKCMGKIDFMQYDTEKPLIKIDYRRCHDNTTQGNPQYYAIAGDYLHLRPVPSSVRNYNLFYPYFPTAIAADNNAIDFIDGFEGLIAFEVAKTALLKEEADVTDMRVELATLWLDFLNTYCGNRIEGEPDFPLTSLNDIED